MTRSKSIAIGAVAVAAAAGILAGCGSGGGSSSPSGQSPPAATPPAASATPSAQAGAGGASVSAVTPVSGQLAAPNGDATIAGYSRFDAKRAAVIFHDPTAVDPTLPATTGSTPSAAPASTQSAGSAGTTLPAPSPAAAPSSASTTTKAPAAPAPALEATMEISGDEVVVRAKDQIPSDTKQFTVQKIGASSVTLKLNAGQLPGGSSTIVVKKGESITLTNQSTGASYQIKVTGIHAQTASTTTTPTTTPATTAAPTK
jgi:hypothetical protein